MSYWSRFRNALRPDAVEREIAEEIESHRDEARMAGEPPTAIGNELRYREASRDLKVLPWLDSLRADVVFAWRQLAKRKAATAIAILSLGFGTGAVLSAFRLLDAGFLRQLPIHAPERLYFLRYSMARPNMGAGPTLRDSFSYDEFRAMRAALGADASLFMISFADRQDITFGGPEHVEKVSRQYVSAGVFSDFRLSAAEGRLFGAEQDDPAADHSIAVLTHDYAVRRFGSARDAIGKRFRYLGASFEVTGVIEPKFAGVTNGAVIDVFLPLLANDGPFSGAGTALQRSARVLVHLREGAVPAATEQRLRAAFQNEREAFLRAWGGREPEAVAAAYREAKLSLLPAASGISNFQRDYRLPVSILASMAALILLLSCASVANLLTIQAAARAREMALRISIGAGRARLVRLLLAESLMLGIAASAAGLLFAYWSAPFVIDRLNPPDNPIRLPLTMDGRLALVAALLSTAVAALFGLLPALRASAASPAEVLKEGAGSIARGGPARVMVAVQVAFCVLVCFAAGLLARSVMNLDRQDLGFAPERLLLIDVFTPGNPPPAAFWRGLAARVKETANAESTAISGWPLQADRANVARVAAGSRPAELQGPHALYVGSGWFSTMGMPLLEGRDFHPDEPRRVAIVNQEFARHYFDGRNPVGESLSMENQRMEIVGMVRDARVRDLREPIRPAVFTPHALSVATVAVRLSAGQSRASVEIPLRKMLANEYPRLRTDIIRTQDDLILAQTVRERLVASLAGFFAAVGLMLAAMGLYGVLAHAVAGRSREIAIRMALGARARAVAAHVLGGCAWPLLVGGAAGLASGLASEKLLGAFLFDASGVDIAVLAPVLLALAGAALAAAAVPLTRAIRIDPARTLRSD